MIKLKIKKIPIKNVGLTETRAPELIFILLIVDCPFFGKKM